MSILDRSRPPAFTEPCSHKPTVNHQSTKIMKRLLCLLIVAAGLMLPAAQAATIIESHDFSGLAAAIPDGNPTGLGNTQNISSDITAIEDITVTLDIAGGFNGDLYVYLQHTTGFAVLLNRVGKTALNLSGYADQGLQISLNDLGPNPDVHLQTSGGGLLTGLFISDGRNIDPDDVLDTDGRTAGLNGFTGLAASGEWTLFVADLSSGSGHTLESWSMDISGVPEPGPAILLLLGAGVLTRRWRRK